jgi:DNA repair exonuclease SbcCD nuclease subunit
MLRLKFVIQLFCILLCLALSSAAQVVIAQLSDTHLGLKGAPEASDNLRRAVEMINQRHPDAVIVSGDIGETPAARREAQEIMSGLKAPIYCVPGNHDDSANDLDAYRLDFGKNYYEFKIKGLTFFGIDSQLLGNFDVFESHDVIPLSAKGQAESQKMLAWFGKHVDEETRELAARQPRGGAAPITPPVFVMQHVPISRDGNFPGDPKPYWTIQEPYRTRELELLHRLGVKHVFLGHWHAGRVFEADGMTYHVAPSTARSLFGDRLGFAMHTITPDGSVKTEFVYLQ